MLCKFYRKTPVLESIFNKVAGLKACNFIKKRLQHRCFPVKFAKFLRTPTLKNICERLFPTAVNLKYIWKKYTNVEYFKMLIEEVHKNETTRITRSSGIYITLYLIIVVVRCYPKRKNNKVCKFHFK